MADSFPAFQAWMESAKDGVIEVKVGEQWMRVTAGDCVSFEIVSGTCACRHPRLLRLSGGDDGFLTYEAWKRAKALHDFMAKAAQLAREKSA